MARLWSSGFELNSITAGMEFSSLTVGVNATASIVTSPVHSGIYALRALNSSIVNNSSCQFSQFFAAADQDGPYFARAYVYFADWPTVGGSQIFAFYQNGGASRANFRLGVTGTLAFNNGSVPIGSSTLLSLNTWYRLEMSYNNNTLTGFAEMEGRVYEGESTTPVATWSSITETDNGGIRRLTWGMVSTDRSYDIYWDDLAVNDALGASQKSWIGPGKLIVLRPDGNVGTPGFVRQGTDSGANWSQVNEVTPNDLTQYVNSTTLNAEDVYTLSPSGIDSSDTVNMVSLNLRYRGNNATGCPTFVPRILKTGGGTVATGNAITPVSTTWITNLASLLTSPLTLYSDPDGSPWTQTTLDSMQAGFRITVDGANRDDITALWVYVDYTMVTSSAPAVIAADALALGLALTSISVTAQQQLTISPPPLGLSGANPSVAVTAQIQPVTDVEAQLLSVSAPSAIALAEIHALPEASSQALTFQAPPVSITAQQQSIVSLNAPSCGLSAPLALVVADALTTADVDASVLLISAQSVTVIGQIQATANLNEILFALGAPVANAVTQNQVVQKLDAISYMVAISSSSVIAQRQPTAALEALRWLLGAAPATIDFSAASASSIGPGSLLGGTRRGSAVGGQGRSVLLVDSLGDDLDGSALHGARRYTVVGGRRR
jgi:hypothetical protein